MNKKHVAIFGYNGFENTGDDAVLQSMLDDFRIENDNIIFTVFSNNPEATTAQYHVNSVKWDELYLVLKTISECDLLIIGGGGLYNSYLKYPKELFLKGNHSFFSVVTFGLPILAALYNKPCMIFGVGASEILSNDAKKHIAIGMEACNEITVRDPQSKEILEQLYGYEKTNIKVTADPVFRLMKNDDEISDIRISKVKQLKKPILGISLRNWSFSGNQDNTIFAISNAINYFCDKYGGSVAFLPFDNGRIVNYLSYDDAIFNKVISLLDKKVEYYKIDGYLQPQIASSIINLCDFCICMRLHSVIMSIRNSVPFIGIVYDQKVRNLLDMVDLGQSAININEINTEILINKMDQTLLLKQQYKDLLVEKTNILKSQAKENIAKAIELLNKADGNVNRYKPIIAETIYASYANTLEEMATESFNSMVNYYFSAGKYEEFISNIGKLTDNDMNADLYYRLAFALHQIRRYNDAEKYYLKAEALGFNEFWICYNRGQLYYEIGETNKAEKDIKKAYQIDPEHPGVKEIVEREGLI